MSEKKVIAVIVEADVENIQYYRQRIRCILERGAKQYEQWIKY